VWGDHHDEFIVRGPNRFEVFKGQKTGFALTTGNRLWQNAYISSGASIELAIGNFTDDYHADFVTSVTSSTSYNGSWLWWGRWNNAPAAGNWVRTDLYSGVAKYVVGNVLRGSFDDLVITTSAGSFVYAGQPTTVAGQRTFIADAWAIRTAPITISQAECLGCSCRWRWPDENHKGAVGSHSDFASIGCCGHEPGVQHGWRDAHGRARCRGSRERRIRGLSGH